MDRKYIIEITTEGITKTFTDSDGKVYTEHWVNDENGMRTKEACITAQMDQDGNYDEQELLDLIEEGDLLELYEYFSQ